MSRPQEDLAALTSVTTRLVQSIRSIESHQWSSATPCSEWDVAALVEHVTGGNWFTVAVLAGDRAEVAMRAVRAKFGDGVATSEAAIQSLDDQVLAFAGPEVLRRTWNHVAGDISGLQILRLRVHDLIVHSWDLDAALRFDATLPDGLARWGLHDLASGDSGASQHFALVDAPAPRPPADASAWYLAHFGRWR